MLSPVVFLIAKGKLYAYILFMHDLEPKQWIDVVIPQPVKQKFTYLVPEKLRQSLCLGHGVIIPFGSRKVTGVIVDFPKRCNVKYLREIEDVLLSYPLLTQELLKLTHWISEYYLCSWGETIRAALPPGILRESKIVIQKVEKNLSSDSENQLNDIQRLVLNAFSNTKELTLKTLQRKSGKKNIRFVLNQLEQMGHICQSRIFENSKVSIQSEKIISLRKQFESHDIACIKKRSPKQAEVLEKLTKKQGEMKKKELQVHTQVIKSLEMKGWIDVRKEKVVREPDNRVPQKPLKLITLTKEQKDVFSTIKKGIENNQFMVFLLHGVTGSGKTQIYIEAIKATLDRGKTALVLIPEISLTPQAVERYRNVFGKDVAVLHSRMSRGERYDSWRKIREGKCRIGLGPRSAVYSPLEDIGCIVVDEEHETSYKQADPNPRYHARDVAVVRGQLNRCVVILGSATPSLESYYNGLIGKYTLCHLYHRIDQATLPKVTIVDRRDSQREKSTNIFTPQLQMKIAERLKNNEQIILLQNRRGYSTFLRCRACGHTEGCPHCDITLTYHHSDFLLKCHYCGFQKKASEECSICGGATLTYRGVGTQKVEEQIHTLFPGVRLFRMDLDTTRRKNAYSEIVSNFENGKREILMGTQMVAKGHDFPGVGLVGVISADVGLYLPDFRSNEHTFQLLAQAAGRAGRRNQQGEVVIQTLSPEHVIFRFVINHDYQAFYQWEIAQRKVLNYPPWGRIILIRFQGPYKENVNQASKNFKTLINIKSFFQCLGPVAAPISRLRNQYRVHLIFRENRKEDPTGVLLKNVIRKGLSSYYSTSHDRDVKVIIDVDPVDML